MGLPGDVGDSSPEDREAAREYEENVRDARNESRNNDSDDGGGSSSRDSSSSSDSTSQDTSREADREAIEQYKQQVREAKHQKEQNSNDDESKDKQDSTSSDSSPQSSRDRDREVIDQYKDQVRETQHENERRNRDRERSSPEVVNRTGDISTDNSLIQRQINKYERSIDQQYGDRLGNDDYQYVVKDSGQVEVRLTDSGKDRLQDSRELDTVEQRARSSVDGRVKRVEVNETFEDGYTATVYTADGREIEQQYSFSQDASEKFVERARERRPTNHTGSFIDTNREGEGVVRVAGSEQLERQRDALEGIGSSEREQARDRIAEKAGVDPEQLDNVHRTEDGRWVATIERERKPSERPDEQFGDLPINLGNDKRVEDYLRAGAATYDDFVKGAVDFNSKYNPLFIYNRKVTEAVTSHAPDWYSNHTTNPTTGRKRGEEFVRGALSEIGRAHV